jgi:hypothetical protein
MILGGGGGGGFFYRVGIRHWHIEMTNYFHIHSQFKIFFKVFIY